MMIVMISFSIKNWGLLDDVHRTSAVTEIWRPLVSDGDRDDHFLSDKIWDWSFWSKFRVCLLA